MGRECSLVSLFKSIRVFYFGSSTRFNKQGRNIEVGGQVVIFWSPSRERRQVESRPSVKSFPHTHTKCRVITHASPPLRVCDLLDHSLSLSFSLQALDNIPLLFYILAAKTLLLCLGFAAVKIYQTNKLEAANKREKEEKRLLALKTQELLDNKKDD